MKKILFSAIAMVAFAGSALASNEVVKEETLKNETLVKEVIVEDDAACTHWVTHYKSCGGTLYLCKDNYATDEDLIRAVIHYDAIQCRGLQPSDPGTGIQG